VHKENVLIERAQDFVRREMQAEKALARAARMFLLGGVCPEYHATDPLLKRVSILLIGRQSG